MQHYSTQELLDVSRKAPGPIQEALSAEATITVITNLSTNLKLSVSQIGLVAELNVQLLLGLIKPAEFLQELIAAGIPDKDANGIMTEITQKILAPLREQMKGEEMKKETAAMRLEQMKSEVMSIPDPTRSVESTVAPQKVEEVPLPPKAPAVVLPRWTYAPPPQSPSYLYPEPEKKKNLAGGSAQSTLNTGRTVSGAVPEPAKDITINTPFTAPKNSINLLARSGAAPVKPTAGEKLLEDHEEPHIEFKSQVPVNLPGMMPPAPTAPAVGPRPIPYIPPARPRPVDSPATVAPQPTPPAPQIRPTPIVSSAPEKVYSTDPYREPIDEETKG